MLRRKRFKGDLYIYCWCDKHVDEVDEKELAEKLYVDDECLHGICKKCSKTNLADIRGSA